MKKLMESWKYKTTKKSEQENNVKQNLKTLEDGLVERISMARQDSLQIFAI
jgi:hypothetical protein